MKHGHSEEMPDRVGMSRRTFLGGSAVAFGTIMLSGALSGCAAPAGGSGSGATPAGGSGGEQVLYELYDTDILIVGGGLAGSHAALEAYKQGKDVVVVEKGPFHFGGACGYNWCNWVNFIQTDTPWDQSEDFVLNELTNKKIAKATHEAFSVEDRNLLLRYAQEGNNLFMRDETGAFVPGLDKPGYPLFGTFSGFPRYFTDSVERSGARIFDQTMITDVIIEDGACIGAVGLHVPTGTVRVFRAKSTVSCTGASSWIYGWNTVAPTSINSPDNTGDVDAAAYRRGAALQDSEFFQFDLISMYPTGLAATFVGGIGADNLCCEYICDANDNYFFRGMDYSTLDRITFTRTIAKAIHDGGGSPSGGVYVDFSNPEAFAAMGEVYRRNAAFAGGCREACLGGSKNALRCPIDKVGNRSVVPRESARYEGGDISSGGMLWPRTKAIHKEAAQRAGGRRCA
ncbi:MAG: FAD-dependent oxidoreductase [Gordonibacter sp.]